MIEIPILISGRGDKVTSRQKDHAREKISKLERYFNGITKIEVVLDRGSDGARAEAVISVKRGTRIVCQHVDKDLYTAIDLMLDKAEVQLTRYKEKIQGKRFRSRGGASAYPEESAPDEQLDTDEEPDTRVS